MTKRKTTWIDILKTAILWALASGGLGGTLVSNLRPIEDTDSRQATTWWFDEVGKRIDRLENRIDNLRDR